MSVDEEIFKEFRRIGQFLDRRGLISSHGGNISVRQGKKMLVKRRGAMLGDLQPWDRDGWSTAGVMTGRWSHHHTLWFVGAGWVWLPGNRHGTGKRGMLFAIRSSIERFYSPAEGEVRLLRIANWPLAFGAVQLLKGDALVLGWITLLGLSRLKIFSDGQ